MQPIAEEAEGGPEEESKEAVKPKPELPKYAAGDKSKPFALQQKAAPPKKPAGDGRRQSAMDALKNQLSERFDLMNAAGSESSENESSSDGGSD